MNIYMQNVADFPDPKGNEGVLKGIPIWRQEKILRYLMPQDRKLSLGVWRLLEKALELNGVSVSEVTADDKGKLKCPHVSFSLSHSDDMALCVVAKNAIGCDIERVEKAPLNVAEKFFTPSEQGYVLSGASQEEVSRRFFIVWTLKESYLKMTGEGIGFSPSRLSVDIGTLKDSLTNIAILRDGNPTPCRLQNFAVGDYVVSICEQL
jgi:4'-phosphopantetheinyl transferase